MSPRSTTVERVHAARARRRSPVASPPERDPGRPLVRRLALAGLFLAAAAYHALQSRAHLTPAIFTDELLYSKLAQSVADGAGFVVRGEAVFFPAPLAAVVQAPAWLVGDVPTAYALAKAWNAVVMASAVFPAYWLASRLVRPRFALLVAAAAVATPAMLYHSYLLSEALAYPVFLLALGTMVRAIERPSRNWELAVVGVSLLAVSTRSQLVALPLAFLAAVPLASALRGEAPGAALRRHALSVGALLGLAVLALAVTVGSGGAALGTYVGAARLDVSPVDAFRWSAFTGALLPFAAGWFVFPAAVLGFAYLLAKPRRRAEAGFAVLTAAAAFLLLVQVGLIAALDAERPLERYTIYLLPLLFIGFFAYVERGAPRRRTYAVLALTLGLLAWLVPFPSLADYLFSFDSPTLSAYGMLAVWLSTADAAAVFAGVPLAASLALAVLPLRRRTAPALAGASIVLLLVVGLVAYAADHGMTQRARRTWAAEPPGWLATLDGTADYLALPGDSPYFGWTLEAWSRNFGRPAYLQVRRPHTDPFAASRATIAEDGRLLVDGDPPGRDLLVVNEHGSALELEGEVVARPRPGLTAYRIGPSPRVRSLAAGLFFDGWGAAALSYRVWPNGRANAGVYRVRLELPRGYLARRVTLAVDGGPSRSVRLEPGEGVGVELPARGYPVPVLRIESDRFDYLEGGTPNPRFVSVRVVDLAYVPAASDRRRLSQSTRARSRATT